MFSLLFFQVGFRRIEWQFYILSGTSWTPVRFLPIFRDFTCGLYSGFTFQWLEVAFCWSHWLVWGHIRGWWEVTSTSSWNPQFCSGCSSFCYATTNADFVRPIFEFGWENCRYDFRGKILSHCGKIQLFCSKIQFLSNILQYWIWILTLKMKLLGTLFWTKSCGLPQCVLYSIFFSIDLHCTLNKISRKGLSKTNWDQFLILPQ